jgi:glyoxylase-like metal-dependent hydrolase (beta-lactamase superfamily II)
MEKLHSQIGSNSWVIYGKNKSYFPSGNAIILRQKDHLVLIDTNPGPDLIKSALKDLFDVDLADISDLVLTHTHLDHGRGISQIYDASAPKIYAHSDTLKRCEKKKLIGLFAGIPIEGIHNFEEFGESIGFRDQSYPEANKHQVSDKQIFKFGEIEIVAHESAGHCPHMLTFTIKDGETSFILSSDFDFSPIPWYGIPQRGDSIDLFKNDTAMLTNQNTDFIVSSHKIELIKKAEYSAQIEYYNGVIDKRVERVISLIGSQIMRLKDIKDYIYPVSRMKGKYSDAYIYCGQSWDYWLILVHLEKAFKEGKVKCFDADGDPFLERCISSNTFAKRTTEELNGIQWAKNTLRGQPNFDLPLNSKWGINS